MCLSLEVKLLGVVRSVVSVYYPVINFCTKLDVLTVVLSGMCAVFKQICKYELNLAPGYCAFLGQPWNSQNA